MAIQTGLTYRNQVMYAVYIRNHTPEGTFRGAMADLARIRGLGVDVVWLLPIHPIGVEGHKGSLGCPYAIRDYRQVNPEYGTLEDFQAFVEQCHALGMRCIIDVVYNHTSPDSVLAQTHPEWFHHKPDGSLGGRVGDWSDVVDLDYSHRELWDYQIETLKQWAAIVDGFRCDVASMVPLEFWLRARQEVEAVRPGCLWLAESVHPQFIAFTRAMGCGTLSDSQLYQAFDITYDYDVFPDFEGYLLGKHDLNWYAACLQRQEVTYPDNFVKLRYLENHDNLRTAFLLPEEDVRWNWTAFLYFQRGMTLLYGGQERGDAHLPSLFDRDPVHWDGPDWTQRLQALLSIKHHPLLTSGEYHLEALAGDILHGWYQQGAQRLEGFFCLKGTGGLVPVDIPDGRYGNRTDGSAVEVAMGRLRLTGQPVVVEYRV